MMLVLFGGHQVCNVQGVCEQCVLLCSPLVFVRLRCDKQMAGNAHKCYPIPRLCYPSSRTRGYYSTRLLGACSSPLSSLGEEETFKKRNGSLLQVRQSSLLCVPYLLFFSTLNVSQDAETLEAAQRTGMFAVFAMGFVWSATRLCGG